MAHGPQSAAPRADDVTTIPFMDLGAQRAALGRRVDDAIMRVLDHGRYVMGPEIDDLEAAIADRTGRRHCVSCASGTDALVMTLMAMDVGPGDRVVVPDFTFVATAEAVRLVGAEPVFADVEPDTLNLCPKSAASAWDLPGPAPVGVIAVDLFGHSARYRELQPVTDHHGAWLVIDGAQSFGAHRNGRPSLAHGLAATTSFFPAKPLGGYGDGGAVVTDDDDLASILRSVRLHGAGDAPYTHDRLGITGRLDTIQAAVLLAKLEVFDEEVDRRNAVADRYARALGDLVEVPCAEAGCVAVWAQYTIELDRRTAVQDRLGDVGVPTAVYYPHPLHTQPAYAAEPVVGTGVDATERACERVLSLPMHPYLDEQTQDRIIAAIRDAVSEA